VHLKKWSASRPPLPPCSWQPYFTVDKMVAFVQQFGIKLIHSFPYYAHANGQVEAINRKHHKFDKENLEDKPRK